MSRIFHSSRRDFLGRAGQLGALTSLGFVAQALAAQPNGKPRTS